MPRDAASIPLGVEARSLLEELLSVPRPIFGQRPPIRVARRGNGVVRVIAWSPPRNRADGRESWDASEGDFEEILSAGLLNRVSDDGPFECYHVREAASHALLGHQNAGDIGQPLLEREGKTFGDIVQALTEWEGEFPRDASIRGGDLGDYGSVHPSRDQR